MSVTQSASDLNRVTGNSYGKSIGRCRFAVSYGPGKHDLHKCVILSQTKKILKRYCLSFFFEGICSYLFYFNFLMPSSLSGVIWSRLGYYTQVAKLFIKSGKFRQSKLSLVINLDQIILDKLLDLGKFK